MIGGLILAAVAGLDGWRWVFYVNLPIGLVALAEAFQRAEELRPDFTLLDIDLGARAAWS